MIVRTTVAHEVTLDSRAVEDVFNRRLDDLCGPEGVYIDDRDGKLKSWDSMGGHGSGYTETLGDPTEVQKAAHALRDVLKETRNKALDAASKANRAQGKKK